MLFCCFVIIWLYTDVAIECTFFDATKYSYQGKQCEQHEEEVSESESEGEGEGEDKDKDKGEYEKGDEGDEGDEMGEMR